MKNRIRKELRSWGWDLLKILVGTLLGAAAFRYFTFPNSIVSGGITGIAQILNLLVGSPVGVMMIILNIPLFIWAWKKLGRSFVVKSLIAMTFNALFIDLLAVFPLEITNDPLLAAVYGGLISGFGWGLALATGASGGGIDIPARLLRRRYPYVNFGTIQLGMNAVIILAFALIFRKFDSCMYTVICMFVSSHIVDVVAYGPMNARLCLIITEKSMELEEAITNHLQRGVTFLHGEGGWSRKEKEVIMCVVKRQQIAELRKIVRGIDPAAFAVVTEARDVYGKGFESIEKED